MLNAVVLPWPTDELLSLAVRRPTLREDCKLGCKGGNGFNTFDL